MNIFLALQYFGRTLIVIFMGLFIFSICLIHGIKICNRGYMLPWLILFGFIVICQTLFGAWIMYRYYIYVNLLT